MNIFVPVVIFAALIYGNFAATLFNLSATVEVAKEFGITLPQEQDPTKVITFLDQYIGFRSKELNTLINLTPFSTTNTGLYYITTLKLTDVGDANSDIVKKGQLTFEHFELNMMLPEFDEIHVGPNPELVYHATDIQYEATSMDKTVGIALKYLKAFGKNTAIRKELPYLGTDKATAQVAVNIVQGNYLGKDMGTFLMVAGYVE